MDDISKIPTEQLQAMLKQQPATQAAPDISAIPTEQLQQMMQQHQSSVGDKVVKGAVAFGSGVAEGAVDAIGSMGKLAHTILTKNQKEFSHPVDKVVNSAMNYVADKWKGVEELRNSPTQYEQQAFDQHPIPHAVGQGTGNVISTVGASNVATKPLQTAADAVMKLAPKALQGPIISQALNQGIQGTAIGAIANPDNPGEGALYGGIGGAVMGTALGAVAKKLQRAGDVVDFEMQNLHDAGVNPHSIEGMSRIKSQLKSNGVDYSKFKVSQIVTGKINEQVKAIHPFSDLEGAPSIKIARLAETNFEKVSSELSAMTKPLRQAKDVFEPTNFNAVKPTLVKSGAPLQSNLTEKPTVNDMWAYRQDLDSTITTIRKSGNATEKASLPTLLNARKALTEDMTIASDQLGLKQNFLDANAKYRNEYLPFQAYRTKGGQPGFQLNQAMKAVNTVLKSRNPDFERLGNIAKTLGKDGDEIIAQATLEASLKRSLDEKGNIKPTALFTKIRELESAGITETVWGKQSKQALVGIKKVLDGAGEAMAPGQMQDFVQEVLNKLPSFIASRPGVALLQTIGSSKTPQTQVRQLITDLLSGLGAMGYSKSKLKNEANKK
jgi:hypothetical protein